MSVNPFKHFTKDFILRTRPFYRKNLECTQCFYRPLYEIIDFHFVKYCGGEKQ